MNNLTIHAADIIPKTVSISAQNPSQTELTNRGLQADGSNAETRTYEVREAALPDFISQQLELGSLENLRQVIISANNSGDGDVYEVSVAINSLAYAESVPYFEQSENSIFKHTSPSDKISGGGIIIN